MKTIGIIPIRSGSKRFPGKNFSEFNNTTLIKNTVNKLQEAHINEILVSTNAIEQVAGLDFGDEVYYMSRKEELAQDNTTIEEVILDIIPKINHPEDYIIILAQVTSPNWNPHRLTYAIHEIESGKYNSIVSVSPDYKPNGAFYIIHKSTFLKYKKLYLPNMYLVKMDWAESTDIDFEYQLYIAESLSRGYYD